MKTLAAVMTGKDAGAIATIGLHGPTAADVIKKITGTITVPAVGRTFLADITRNGSVIDHVLIGCEGENNFTINCHGNPLIVSDIMRLLESEAVETVSAKQLIAGIYSKQLNTIAIEAKLTIADAKTLDAAKIITNQINTGLSKTLSNWKQTAENGSLDNICSEAKTILEFSRKIKPVLFGCKIVLAGPPNSGKSTLLNFLAGKEKTLVTDIKGTTRDWVSAHCKLGNLSAEVFDTAGLDEALSANTAIDNLAQQKVYEILAGADLVLVVMDISEPEHGLSERFLELVKDKSVIAVLNKCDLPAKLDTAELLAKADKTKPPADFGRAIEISAKNGTNIKELIERIQQDFAVEQTDFSRAVCFTERQERLLNQITNAQSQQEMLSAIAELLNGPV